MKTRVAPSLSLSLSRLWGPAFALGAALGLCVASAHALSDRQHRRMLRDSPAYARADAELGRAWKALRESLDTDGPEWRRLLAEQREWLRSGRDREARALRGDGSEADGYAAAARERAAYLREQAEAPADGGDVGSTSSAPAARTNRHLVFKLPDLPDGLQWARGESPELAERGVAMFGVQGYTESTTPVRVIYQKLTTDDGLAAARDRILEPLKSCPGHRVEEFRGVSRHPEQLNVEAHCPKLGAKDSGLISQIALFKDSDFTHVVVGETRIALPGGEERAERLAGLLREAVRDIRSCDEAKNCL